MIGFCISDNKVCEEAAKKEIVRRYYHETNNYRLGKNDEDTYKKIKLLMNELGIDENYLYVIKPALEKSQKEKLPVISLKIGKKIITGKETDILTPASSLILNAIKETTKISDMTSIAHYLPETAVFSENEQELMFYEGEKLDPKMKDIIDMNYGGALGCQSLHEAGNIVTVVTKAYFDVLYASGDKVFFKKQVFSATLKRRTDIPVNLNFSITNIACPSCGASFDAMKNRNCPFCGNRYEITTDDWALVELKYN